MLINNGPTFRLLHAAMTERQRLSHFRPGGVLPALVRRSYVVFLPALGRPGGAKNNSKKVLTPSGRGPDCTA